MATCRNCAHYDLEAHRRRDGKIVVRKNIRAKCLFDPARLERQLPLSVRPHYLTGKTIPQPGWMAPDDGNGCPQFVKREASHA